MTRRAAKPAAPAWTGFLARTPDGIRGRLDGACGWGLLLTALPAATGNPPVPADPPRLHVRADVDRMGEQVPGRATLADLPFLAGILTREGAVWRGEIAVRDLVLTLAAWTTPFLLACAAVVANTPSRTPVRTFQQMVGLVHDLRSARERGGAGAHPLTWTPRSPTAAPSMPWARP